MKCGLPECGYGFTLNAVRFIVDLTESTIGVHRARRDKMKTRAASRCQISADAAAPARVKHSRVSLSKHLRLLPNTHSLCCVLTYAETYAAVRCKVKPKHELMRANCWPGGAAGNTARDTGSTNGDVEEILRENSLTFIQWEEGERASLVRRQHPHLILLVYLSFCLATPGFISAKGQTNVREGQLNIHVAAAHREGTASFNTAGIIKAGLQ